MDMLTVKHCMKIMNTAKTYNKVAGSMDTGVARKREINFNKRSSIQSTRKSLQHWERNAQNYIQDVT